MSSWRIIAALGAALLVVLLLYPSGQRQSVELGRKPPTEITLWFTGDKADPLRTVAELFETRHKNDPDGGYRVLVGSGTVLNSTEDSSRFLLGVAGGSPPDLMYYDRFAVVSHASRGAFEDLTPYIERDKNLPDAIRPDRYFKSMWNEASYKGGQYAIPASADTRALLINDDSLERAGFKDDQGRIIPPKTWEQLCLRKAWGKATVSGNFVTLPEAKGVAKVKDLVTLRAPGHATIFRARIGAILANGSLELAPSPADGEKVDKVPGLFQGTGIEAKVFDQESYAIALTRFDADGNMLSIGFSPLFGNSHLYMFGWENGATYMSPDASQCLLAQDEVQGALQFIVDTYDAMGGYERVKAFEGSFQIEAQDPFLLGKVAMRVDGDFYLKTIATYKPDMRFSAVWAPIPEKRLDAGEKPITWMGGWAWAIPATAKHKEAAWELLKFMMSQEGRRTQAEVEAGIARATGKPYIPPLNPDVDIHKKNREVYMINNPQVSPRLLAAYDLYSSMADQAKYRPVTPVGQKLWNEHMLAQERACAHTMEVPAALHIGQRNVQHALDRLQNPPKGTKIDWNILVYLYVGVVGLGVLGAILAERRRRRKGHGRRDWISGYVGISPWLIGFLVFSLGPILFSLIISFCHWDILNEAQFTGLDNYEQLLGTYSDPATGEVIDNDAEFWTSLRNTGFMVISVPLSIILGLGIALLLSSAVRGMAFFRTVYYLPAIVPAVATFMIWVWVFNDQHGIMNMTLRWLGMDDPPKWLQSQTWAKPALVIMGLWSVGSGMLIWLAGLKNIPEQLYEAAAIDGAGRIRRFFHITLPMLSPYLFFNFVLGLIGVFQIFEPAYLMTNGGPSNSTLFYSYKLFNEAFRYLNMGTASAMAWIMFLIIMGLTLLNLWAGKRWVHYE
jgi:ABC-type sugar transport system permease subunit/ABC-type glycerol-3-phosphate transport system substrate-binding protein